MVLSSKPLGLSGGGGNLNEESLSSPWAAGENLPSVGFESLPAQRINRFFMEATDPSMAVGMAFGAGAFNGARSLVLPLLMRSSAPILSQVPLLARVAASSLAMVPEVATFWATSKAIQGLTHPGQFPGDGRSQARELAGLAMTLGFLKSFGFVASGIGAAAGARSVAFLPKHPLFWQQAGMLSGIMAGHGAEIALGWRPSAEFSEFLTDSLVTLGQFNLGGALSQRIFPGIYRTNHLAQQAMAARERAQWEKIRGAFETLGDSALGAWAPAQAGPRFRPEINLTGGGGPGNRDTKAKLSPGLKDQSPTESVKRIVSDAGHIDFLKSRLEKLGPEIRLVSRGKTRRGLVMPVYGQDKDVLISGFERYQVVKVQWGENKTRHLVLQRMGTKGPASKRLWEAELAEQPGKPSFTLLAGDLLEFLRLDQKTLRPPVPDGREELPTQKIHTLKPERGVAKELASLGAETPSLVEAYSGKGISRQRILELEAKFEGGNVIIDLPGRGPVIAPLESGATTIGVLEKASPQDRRFYDFWKEERGFVPVDLKKAEESWKKIQDRSTRLRVPIRFGKNFYQDPFSKPGRAKEILKEFGGPISVLDDLLELLPDSFLSHSKMEAIRLNTDRVGAGLLSSYENSKAYLFEGTFLGSRRNLVGLFLHELGHASGARYYLPEKSDQYPGQTYPLSRDAGDPDIHLAVREKMHWAHRVISENDALIGLDYAGGSLYREGVQANHFSEFMAELPLLYVAAGPRLRAHVASFPKGSEVREAWDFVYGELKERIFDGWSYDFRKTPRPPSRPDGLSDIIVDVVEPSKEEAEITIEVGESIPPREDPQEAFSVTYRSRDGRTIAGSLIKTSLLSPGRLSEDSFFGQRKYVVEAMGADGSLLIANASGQSFLVRGDGNSDPAKILIPGEEVVFLSGAEGGSGGSKKDRLPPWIIKTTDNPGEIPEKDPLPARDRRKFHWDAAQALTAMHDAGLLILTPTQLASARDTMETIRRSSTAKIPPQPDFLVALRDYYYPVQGSSQGGKPFKGALVFERYRKILGDLPPGYESRRFTVVAVFPDGRIRVKNAKGVQLELRRHGKIKVPHPFAAGSKVLLLPPMAGASPDILKSLAGSWGVVDHDARLQQIAVNFEKTRFRDPSGQWRNNYLNFLSRYGASPDRIGVKGGISDGKSTLERLQEATHIFRYVISQDPRGTSSGSYYDFLVQVALERALAENNSPALDRLTDLVASKAGVSGLTALFQSLGWAQAYQFPRLGLNRRWGDLDWRGRLKALPLSHDIKEALGGYLKSLHSGYMPAGLITTVHEKLGRPREVCHLMDLLDKALKRGPQFPALAREIRDALERGVADPLPFLYFESFFKVLEAHPLSARLRELGRGDKMDWALLQSFYQAGRVPPEVVADMIDGSVYTGYLQDPVLAKKMANFYYQVPNLTSPEGATERMGTFYRQAGRLLGNKPTFTREDLLNLLAINPSPRARFAKQFLQDGDLDIALVTESEMARLYRSYRRGSGPDEVIPHAFFVPEGQSGTGRARIILTEIDPNQSVPVKIGEALRLTARLLHEFEHYLHHREFQGRWTPARKLQSELRSAMEEQSYLIWQGDLTQWQASETFTPEGFGVHLRKMVETNYLSQAPSLGVQGL